MSYEPSDAKELFLQAVELTSAEDRNAFLERACRGNGELRARVEQLLQSNENPGSFLGQPALADLTATTLRGGFSRRGGDTPRRDCSGQRQLYLLAGQPGAI